MRQIKMILFCYLLFLIICSQFSWADEVTITTYYPAPSGTYRNFEVTRDAYFCTELDIWGNPMGNVGIGTTSPGVALHIDAGPRTEILRLVGDASTVMSFHEGVTRRGFVQYDTGTNIFTVAAEEAGSGMQLRTADTIQMAIDSNGNVGIGTTNPGYSLTVAGTTWCTSGAWSGSDLRWKENVETIASPLEKVLRLRGTKFDWKREQFKDNNFPEGRQIGIIAQELEQEFPELVTTNREGYKAIAYDRLSAVLVEAIKAQNERITELEARLNIEQ